MKAKRRNVRLSQQRQRTADGIDVGGTYQNAAGENYYVRYRTQNGKILIAFKTGDRYLRRYYFTELGHSLDGGLPLYWYSLDGAGVPNTTSKSTRPGWWKRWKNLTGSTIPRVART